MSLTNRPKRYGFSRVREALTARRVSDKGAEYNQFQEIHALQSLCLYPQRKRHFETGKYLDCQHQRGRGKSRGGFLGKCDTFAGGKKSAHSVGLLNNNQSVNW